ncbi:hypothetical protein FB451DRAFT_1520923 [Mycena latifolia]|nr:hypothetical protein FB451DRAFT_1520923 [Mycena latifolia]
MGRAASMLRLRCPLPVSSASTILVHTRRVFSVPRWNLLGYLAEKSLSATFFVVGSRVIEYPDLLINEYMAGHEISVHTWSHPLILLQLRFSQKE